MKSINPIKSVHSHNNFFVFNAALIFLLLASAIISESADYEHSIWVRSLIFGVTLVAYLSLNLGRAWRVFVILMMVLQAIGELLNEATDWHSAPLVGLGAQLLFFCGMMVAAARQALFTGDIEANTIAGTVTVYLLMGLVWATLYLIALEFWPDAFNGLEYRDWSDNMGPVTYYSYVTLTTLGYGDVSPAVPVTKVLAYLQAITGTFFMAVVVASFVGALSRKSNHSN